MLDTIIHDQLGAGIYSVPDIAFILDLPQPKVRRWLNDFWDNRLGSQFQDTYSWGTGKHKTTNFFTLIEFYVFYKLRELKFGTKKIFSVHDQMARAMKTPYPFASAKLLSDGKDIWYSLADETTISTKKEQQIVIKEIILQFSRKIEFSKDDVAERFWPLGKDKKIVVDPHHQFGLPVIEGTNVLAETVYRLSKAGDKISTIKKLYNLTEAQIDDALALFNRKAA